MEEGLGNLAAGQVLLLLVELEHLDKFSASQALNSCTTLNIIWSWSPELATAASHTRCEPATGVWFG